jgi:hypothetical protein
LRHIFRVYPATEHLQGNVEDEGLVVHNERIQGGTIAFE